MCLLLVRDIKKLKRAIIFHVQLSKFKIQGIFLSHGQKVMYEI